MTFRRKLTLTLVGLSVLTALLTALVVGALATRRLKASLAENLKGIVATASLKLDADAFARIVTPTNPEVVLIRTELEHIAAANPNLSNLYTGRAMGDEFVFIVDGYARGSELASLGEKYLLEPEMRTALAGTATANPTLISDSYGTWISGYAPIRRDSGEVVGIIGADYSADTVFDAWKSFGVSAGILMLLVLAAAVTVALILSHTLNRPLEELMSGFRRLEEGDRESQVHITAPPEFALLGEAFNNAERSVRERDLLKGIFGTYMERDVAEKILTTMSPEGIQGEMRRATLLFSDIRGYTSWSEDKHPLKLLTSLNAYFAKMIDEVLIERGTIDKFIGDALMVIFGAPNPSDDHADRAVAAAVRMQELMRRGRFPFAMGVGINTGDVVLGTVGSPKRMSYTAMGDNVNLAQRLESKALPGQILISRETFFALQRPELFDIKKIPAITVKGKTAPIEVYEVRGFAVVKPVKPKKPAPGKRVQVRAKKK